MPESSRTHYATLEHIQPEGMEDFWSMGDLCYDNTVKGKTFDIDTIIDSLFSKLVRYVDGKEDWTLLEPYLQIIMDKNIGSIVCDW